MPARDTLVMHDLRAASSSRAAPSSADLADVLLGTARGAVRLSGSAVRLSGRLAVRAAKIASPVLGLALRPPLVPPRLQPGYTLQLLTERWQHDRPEALRALGRWSATAVPYAVDPTLA